MDPQTESLVAGESLSLPITVVDSAGDPVNLAGGTPAFYLARRAGGTIVASTETSPATATAALNSPASDGVITVTIGKTVTATLLGSYEWQAHFTDGSGNKTVVARGYLNVRAKAA